MTFLDELKAARDKSKLRDAVASGISYVAAMAGPESSKEEIERRKTVCSTCDIKDVSGEKLFREKNGSHYCGAERREMILRNSPTEGCGCKLESKWSKANSSCPNRKW